MQQEDLTLEDIAAFTDKQLRDELQHAAYVVATLFATDLEGHARERLEVFKTLRSETQTRHGGSL